MDLNRKSQFHYVRNEVQYHPVRGNFEIVETVCRYQNSKGGKIQLLLCTISKSLAANKDIADSDGC